MKLKAFFITLAILAGVILLILLATVAKTLFFVLVWFGAVYGSVLGIMYFNKETRN